MDPVLLNPYFKAFYPHVNCNKDEVVLLHYVKEDLQRQFIENYKNYGTFCDAKWVSDHKNK